MSRKISVYLTNEAEKHLEDRVVQAVIFTQKPVEVSDLIRKHLEAAYKMPLNEVMQ